MTENKPKRNWVSMGYAAKQVGSNTPKISRLVREGKLETHKSIRDVRVTYVDLDQVIELFRSDPQ